MAFEAGVGYDYITEQEVGPWGRVFRAGGALLPLAGRLKSLGNLKYFKSAKNAVKEFLTKVKSGKYLSGARPGFVRISCRSNLAGSIRQQLSSQQQGFTNKIFKEELDLLVSKSTGTIKNLNIEELLIKEKIEHVFLPARHHLEVVFSDVEEIAYKVGKEIVKLDELGKVASFIKDGVNLIIDGYKVNVRGTIINGKMRWGTIFIPHDINICPANPCPFVKVPKIIPPKNIP